MEVHHHPEVEKKGIKEYLLEGLMIFVAVLMGFIAENVREGITEHQKAKDYAVTMVADLSTDTSQLRNYIGYYKFANANVDTLMQLLSTIDIKNIRPGKLYLYGLWGGAQRFFIPNDATFQQMKSTGALQYFERSVARKVSEYDLLCHRIQTFDAGEENIYAEVRKLRSQIFEFQYNTKSNDLWKQVSPNYKYSTKKADLDKINAFIKSNPPLLTTDKSIFNQYVELVRSRYIDRKILLADSALNCAAKLIGSIKKEYPNSE